jgi:hypothetical protein
MIPTYDCVPKAYEAAERTSSDWEEKVFKMTSWRSLMSLRSLQSDKSRPVGWYVYVQQRPNDIKINLNNSSYFFLPTSPIDSRHSNLTESELFGFYVIIYCNYKRVLHIMIFTWAVLYLYVHDKFVDSGSRLAGNCLTYHSNALRYAPVCLKQPIRSLIMHMTWRYKPHPPVDVLLSVAEAGLEGCRQTLSASEMKK